MIKYAFRIFSDIQYINIFKVKFIFYCINFTIIDKIFINYIIKLTYLLIEKNNLIPHLQRNLIKENNFLLQTEIY